jgi:hypothetical protein
MAWGLGIWDPRSRNRNPEKTMPDSKPDVKKAPYSGSGLATVVGKHYRYSSKDRF